MLSLALPALMATCAHALPPAHPPFHPAATHATAPKAQEKTMPLVPVDQQGPPGSRVRSPVLDQALAANSNAALIMFLLKYPDDPFA